MKIFALSLAGILLLGLAGFGGYQAVQANQKFTGTELIPPRPAADFTLSSDRGDVRLSDFRGKTVLLFFGYTHCTDVCPLTLANMAQAVRNLGAGGAGIQVIFVTVDPGRDTPAVAGQYARSFSPAFIGLSGDAGAISAAARDYGIYYAKTDIQSPTVYSVSHTSDVIVIDPQGRWRLLWPGGASPAEMTRDLQLLERR